MLPCGFCGSNSDCFADCECAKCMDPEGYERWKNSDRKGYIRWLASQAENESELEDLRQQEEYEDDMHSIYGENNY